MYILPKKSIIYVYIYIYIYVHIYIYYENWCKSLTDYTYLEICRSRVALYSLVGLWYQYCTSVHIFPYADKSWTPDGDDDDSDDGGDYADDNDDGDDDVYLTKLKRNLSENLV